MKVSLLIAMIVLIIAETCFGQELNWKQSKNWKLYSINEFSVFNYSPDTLKNFSTIGLDNDTVQSFLSKAKKMSKEEAPVWMGLYFLTCEMLNENIRKVEVSIYGGFFYDELTKTYYELPQETRETWLNYLSLNYKKIKSNS